MEKQKCDEYFDRSRGRVAGHGRGGFLQLQLLDLPDPLLPSLPLQSLLLLLFGLLSRPLFRRHRRLLRLEVQVGLVVVERAELLRELVW